MDIDRSVQEALTKASDEWGIFENTFDVISQDEVLRVVQEYFDLKGVTEQSHMREVLGDGEIENYIELLAKVEDAQNENLR